MFKTSDLYELISWLILGLFWLGKTTPRMTALPDCAQNKGLSPDEGETKPHAFDHPSDRTKDSGSCGNDVWFYSEALALSRKNKSRSNERRRKEDRREAAACNNERTVSGEI